MADTNQNISKKYDALNQLSIEALEKLLRTADPASNSAAEDAYFAVIEEVFIKKVSENPSGRLPDIDEARKRFQQDYAAPETRGIQLYGEAPTEQSCRGKPHFG